MSSCKKIETFPEIRCVAKYSISRLPGTVPARCDTTDLTALYAFTTEDLGSEWTETIVRADGGDFIAAENECTGVAGDVSNDDSQFISFLESALEVAGDRNWVCDPMPCTEGEPSVTLASGAVSFAQAPIRSISLPTFVPRAGGGGKGNSSVECTQTIFCIGVMTKEDTAELYTVNNAGKVTKSGIIVKVEPI